ncbi:MAG: tRNA (adenosine(37)-N6)-threonylcarbamoyltransferase complex dimerization subunit type 1 TsaB [Thermodesulfobacteriota bacterium]
MASPVIHSPAPLILAVENSTMCGSVALVSGGSCLYEQSLLSSKTHSKRLLPSLKRAMAETGLEWDELDALAVSLGPGSFTGLRIGLATIKGLALATGLPLIGVSSLSGLASQFPHCSLQLCPILDARKSEVYTALYQNQAGVMTRTSDYLVMEPSKLCRLLKEPTLFVGDGVPPYQEEISAELGPLAHFAPGQGFFPRAASLGQLAVSRYLAEDFSDPATAVPIYIRASEAEINLRQKQLG